jgi:hypothetical protein
MKLSTLSAIDASILAVRTLGLDPDLIDLTSTEALVDSLRRAASFMCPTSPSRLVDAVMEAVRPVSPEGSVDRHRLVEILDLLIGEGDLLELRHEAERSTRLLYLGPPSFIEREPGVFSLVGVRPYGMPLLDADLADSIEREGHTRTLRFASVDATEQLARRGLQQMSARRWVASPRQESAAQLLQRIGAKLDAAGPSGDIEDLLVLDPATPARYYKGRWRVPKLGDSGAFVARRPQAYGADLWSAVRLDDGSPKKLVEFPTDDPLVSGRDEAWRMQMAIDNERGIPQVFRVTPTPDGVSSTVAFFSPLPGFAERYLQLIGLALPEAPKALFAFRVPNGAMITLSTYMAGMLWMKPLAEETGL